MAGAGVGALYEVGDTTLKLFKRPQTPHPPTLQPLRGCRPRRGGGRCPAGAQYFQPPSSGLFWLVGLVVVLYPFEFGSVVPPLFVVYAL